jgi:hypothetical protein
MGIGRVEVGGWRSEIGDWRLETGDWRVAKLVIVCMDGDRCDSIIVEPASNPEKEIL